jgi:hypothetical protein
MSPTRQQQRLANRSARKRAQSDARTQSLSAEVARANYPSVICPCCGQSVYPKTMDYLPKPGTFKQYRCVHCGAWLTIDLRSRIKLIVVASIGLVAGTACYIKLLIAIGVRVREHQNAVLWPFAIVVVSWGQYALARYMRKIARWKAVED